MASHSRESTVLDRFWKTVEESQSCHVMFVAVGKVNVAKAESSAQQFIADSLLLSDPLTLRSCRIQVICNRSDKP